MNIQGRFFSLRKKNTTLDREILAGLVTFMTMAYILFVNPMLLSKGGIPFESAVLATAFSAALTTILMGLVTDLPFALAAGMGYNAFFAYTVTTNLGIPWPVAIGCVFWEGLIFLGVMTLPCRETIFKSIPLSLKLAASVGIGIFIAFIGLSEANIIVASPGVKVALGNLHSPAVLLSIFGVLITGLLLAFRVKGALLWGILIITIVGVFVPGEGLAPVTRIPETLSDIFQIPSRSVFQGSFFQLDVLGALRWPYLPVIFTFLFFDVFDTVGSVAGLAAKLGILNQQGSFSQVNRVLTVDALGTVIGALCGTTTVTTYIESAAGVMEGGRTGLTAVVVGLCFALSVFLAPLAKVVPPTAVAPALVLVGLFMMEPIAKIDFADIGEGLPAFLTIIMMPLTYNIAHGLAAGIVSYAAINLLSGRWRRVSPLMYGLAVLFILYYSYARLM
ncbi:MAG: NCS2 family permease [Candidatus Omnitrophica bacterium]|nr:NCS2 family permease [Candidatus Omnitrophota bacterium]